MKPRQVPRTPSRWRLDGTTGVKAHLEFVIHEGTRQLERAQRIWDRALDARDSGLRSPSLEAGGGTRNDGGAPESSVERAAFARLDGLDDVSFALRGYLGSLAKLASVMADLRKHGAVLYGLDPDDARKLVEEPERGQFCENPNHPEPRWVSNSGRDRIRAGRCEACGKYKQRYGSDRSREMIEEAEKRKGEAA